MSLLRKPIKFHKNSKTKILTNVRTLHERVQATNKNTKVKNQFSTIPQIVRQGSDYFKIKEFRINFYRLEFEKKTRTLDCAQRGAHIKTHQLLVKLIEKRMKKCSHFETESYKRLK